MILHDSNRSTEGILGIRPTMWCTVGSAVCSLSMTEDAISFLSDVLVF